MAEKITEFAYGRVGLLGNPSDIYGGKCISFTFNKSAQVSIEDSLEFIVDSNSNSDFGLVLNDSNKLILGTLIEMGLSKDGLKFSYNSDIPIGAGLSGSSAIIIATIKALIKKYSFNLSREEIAERALHTEVERLGIAAGFQDRYSIAFGGVLYMDFSGKEYQRKDSYGRIENLEVNDIPFFLCLGMKPKSSASVHNSLRERFLTGGEEAKKIKKQMDDIAFLAEEGKEVLLNRNWKRLGELMNENTKLREKISPHLKMDKKMIDYALMHGALGAKVAGSGGCVVVLFEDRKVFDEISREYPCLRPLIARYD